MEEPSCSNSAAAPNLYLMVAKDISKMNNKQALQDALYRLDSNTFHQLANAIPRLSSLYKNELKKNSVSDQMQNKIRQMQDF